MLIKFVLQDGTIITTDYDTSIPILDFTNRLVYEGKISPNYVCLIYGRRILPTQTHHDLKLKEGSSIDVIVPWPYSEEVSSK